MRRPVFFIFLPVFSTLTAQPALVSNALPPIGTGTTYHMVDNFWSIDTTQQGTGVTWDLSGIITAGPPNTWAMVDPAATPNGTSFPNANYARMHLASNTVTYFERTETYLDILGNDQSGVVIFDDPQRVLVFPMTFGTTNSDVYEEWGTVLSHSITGIGTGTLILPTGTFPDVVMIRTINSGWFHPIYDWYSTENGRMLLHYTWGDGFSPIDAQMLTTASSTSVSEHSLVNGLFLVDPVIDVLEIMYSSRSDTPVELVIANTIGQVMRAEVFTASAGEQRKQFFVGDLARGVYLLTVRHTDEHDASRTIRFVKQ